MHSTDGQIGNDNTPTVDPAKIRLAVVVELKEIPGFKAIMAKATKRATEWNTVGYKDDDDGDNREGDNNHMNNGE